MQDRRKTKAQLVAELQRARTRISELEATAGTGDTTVVLRRMESVQRALVDSVGDALFLIDLDGNLILCNRAFAERFRLRQDQLNGLNVYDLVDEDVAQRRKGITRQIAQTGEPVQFEDERGGRTIESRLFPVRNADGRIEQVAIFSRDITARVHAERERREKERRTQKTFDAVKAGVLVQAANGRITFANSAAAEIFGMAASDITDMTSEDPVWHMVTDDGTPVPGYRHPSMITLRTGKPVTNAVRGVFTQNPNETRWLLINTEPIFEPGDQQPAEVIVTFTDITEQKRVEQRLQQSEQRVRSKLESLLEPTAEVGHVELPDVMDIDAIQALMDDFHAITGFGVAILDLSGNILVATGWQDICTKFHRVHPETSQYCRESDTELTKNVKRGKFRIYRCRNNMWDMVTPIYVGEKHIGNLFLGQFLFESEQPDREFFRAQARKYGFDEDEYLAALDRVPRWTRASVQTTMRFYSKLTSIISSLSYANVKLARLLTERDELVRRLRTSEESLLNAQRIAKIGSWEYDMANNRTKWSKEACRIFGSDRDCQTGTWDEHRRSVHPDDTAPVDRAIQAAKNDGTDFTVDFRIVRPDGAIRYARAMSRVTRDDSGAVVSLSGTVQDLTAERLAAQKLQDANRKLEALWDVASLADADIDTICDHVLTSITEMTGSEFGFFGFIDASETDMEIHSWSDRAMAQCAVHNAPRHFPIQDAGIWAEAVRKRKTLILNDFAAPHEGKKGVPRGHVKMTRLMVVPVTSGDRVVSVGAVANKTSDYTDADANQVSAFLTSIQSIVDNKRAEEEKLELRRQLEQAQKMEAIGRLAGGIAHDFNNLLTGIMGNIDLIMMDLPKSDPMHETMMEIDAASERAAALTRQLLTFSRKQPIKTQPVNPNELLSDLDRLLGQLIGEDVRIVWDLSPHVGHVSVDRGQIQQVIVNMAVNARDAMPDGGTLTIATANRDVGVSEQRGQLSVTPGRYAVISVTDDGCGMGPDVAAKVFEPFFTTKKEGGTGLGLATSFGIVQQHGGTFNVHSTPGEGTTFEVFLPQSSPMPERIADQPTERTLPRGGESILVVEDDSLVRNIAVKTLTRQGYSVLHADSGRNALEIFHTADVHVDLLLTDIVMPEMNGRELAERLIREDHDLRVLFTSGYTKNIMADDTELTSSTHFIAKPYTPHALANRVREVLDESRPTS